MERYALRVAFKQDKENRSVVIVTAATTDDDAIQAAHALADFAQFGGASAIEIHITGDQGRDVGLVSDFVEVPEMFERRGHRTAATYRSN